jgi:hypothetical protein
MEKSVIWLRKRGFSCAISLKTETISDALVIFVVGLRDEVVYSNDGDRVLVEERYLHGT